MFRLTPNHQCVRLFDGFSRNPAHVEERITHSINTLYKLVYRRPDSV